MWTSELQVYSLDWPCERTASLWFVFSMLRIFQLPSWLSHRTTKRLLWHHWRLLRRRVQCAYGEATSASHQHLSLMVGSNTVEPRWMQFCV